SGLAIAREFKPQAVILDLKLPDLDGWTVLDRLKHDSSTRHIPVHIISVEGNERRGLQQGALAHLTKPVTREALVNALDNIQHFLHRPVKNLLIVEDNDTERQAMVELINDTDLFITAVSTGEEALAALERQVFDCLVIDLMLPDLSGFELISRIKQQMHHYPII